MNKLQSWNLNSIINNYNNQIFTNDIDSYRTINYDNLESYMYEDFDSQIIISINNIKLDTHSDYDYWANLYIEDSTGSNTVYQYMTMKNKTSNQPILKFNFQEDLNINIHSITSVDSYTLVTEDTKLEFSKLNQIDITTTFYSI